MKNKRLIILLSVLAVIILFVVLSSTVFTLKTVVINFYDKNDKLISDISVANKYYNTAESVQGAIDKTEFRYGQNIFIINKNNYKIKMEKNNPYIKVISVTTEFPNRIVVKAVEREEMYAVSADNNYLICDAEFKVLRLSNEKPANLILVNSLSLEHAEQNLSVYIADTTEYATGDFIAKDNLLIQKLSTIYDEMYVNNYDTPEMLNFFKTISVFVESASSGVGADNVDSILITTRAGVKIEIENIASDLDKKIEKCISAYVSLKADDEAKTTYGTIKVLDNLQTSWTW